MSSPVTVADLDDRLVEIENDGALICVSRAGLHLLAIVHKHSDMGCFCGSNVPFRECCNGKYDYDLNMWNKRILSAVRKTTPDDECCAWPDKGGKTCGQVMNSHSAQAALLQGICDVDKDGRTATGKNYVLSMDGVTRDDFDESAFGFPIGINRAGTFRRFCQPHDTEAFKSIESGARFKGDTRQFLEVGYRAACFTDYCGRFINAQIQEYIDCLVRQGFPGPVEGRDQVLRGHMRGVDEAVHKYDVMIANGDLRDVDGVSFEIEGEMSFIATGYNRIARSLRSSKGEGLIGFGIVPSAEPGRFCIVFSWFRSDRIARSFAKDLASINPEFLPMALLQTIFATTQNIFFSKQWADTLPSGLKDHLKLLNSAERVGCTDKVETNKRLAGFRLTGITYCPIEQKSPIRMSVTPPTLRPIKVPEFKTSSYTITDLKPQYRALAVLNLVNLIIRCARQSFMPKSIANALGSLDTRRLCQSVNEGGSEVSVLASLLPRSVTIHDDYPELSSNSSVFDEIEIERTKLVFRFERAIASLHRQCRLAGMTTDAILKIGDEWQRDD